MENRRGIAELNMGEKLEFDEKYKAFTEVLHREVQTFEQCEKNVVQALAIVAEELKLGKVKYELDAPVSKIRPHGEHRVGKLFDNQKGAYGKAKHQVFTLSDGGTMTLSVYPREDEEYTKDELETQQLLLREIYFQFSRIIMQGLLRGVLQTDMATGVANQEAFMQFIGKQLATGQIQTYIVFFFNVHNFKYVNKIFPYEEGDVVLRNYAGIVDNLLLEDEIVARLGGDNFVALVKNERSEIILAKLQNLRLYYRTEIKEKEFIFSATIGVSTLEDIRAPRDVMARASVAYQAARQRGSGTVAYYSTEIRNKLMETQSVISSFLPALEAHEFVVYYQPKVDVNTNKICGAEALVRWMHDGELIPPMRFIPQLEREGSVCKLDYYVLEETCRFIRKRLDEGKTVPCISVNFSRKHLEEDYLVKRIVNAIDKYEIDHRYIEIELTESEDFQNYEIMSEIVNGLRLEGIATSIDDFGTGYSSLNMIRKVDLNVIKIDKSFIPLETEYPDKQTDMVMFVSIVDLVRKLGKKTIAEGVETKEQLQYLREVGCDIVQGYVFDKPMPEKEFAVRLEQGYKDGE